MSTERLFIAAGRARRGFGSWWVPTTGRDVIVLTDEVVARDIYPGDTLTVNSVRMWPKPIAGGKLTQYYYRILSLIENQKNQQARQEKPHNQIKELEYLIYQRKICMGPLAHSLGIREMTLRRALDGKTRNFKKKVQEALQEQVKFEKSMEDGAGSMVFNNPGQSK